MEPISLEDWDAVIIRDAPRFRHKKRIVKEADVPEEIRDKLEADARARKALKEQHIAEKLADESAGMVEQPIEGMRQTPPELGIVSETIIPVQDGIATQIPDPVVTDESSIYTVSLEMLARAMYERFGIYTSFINEYPRPEDIHPFTGEYMTMYEAGLARQMHTRFQSAFRMNEDYEAKKAGADTSRAMSEIAQAHVPRPLTPQEDQEQNSFDYRTGIQNVQSSAATMRRGDGQYGIDKDEIITDEDGRQVTIRSQW